jgi:hypothetical protein
VKQGVGFKVNAHDFFVFQDPGCFFKVMSGCNELIRYFRELMNCLILNWTSD